MITFKLEDADAVALVNTVVGLHFEPNFQAPLVEQLAAQYKEPVAVVEAPVVEEAPKSKKTKAAEAVEGDK